MTDILEEFHTINGDRLEVQRVIPDHLNSKSPAILLLHEGLGSVSMWKDFPVELANSTDCEVIAYSRAGYGKSSAARLPRDIKYMHEEGLMVLPQLIRSIGVNKPVLFGHSDGASIALICAGGTDTDLSGLILMAPHIFVEPVSVDSITAVRQKWEHSDLAVRLAKYHDDVKSAFFGWNDIWLKAEFLNWNIEEFLNEISLPLLVVQGEGDEYGTMAQIDTIKKAIPGAELLKLADCGHSPHKDQPELLITEVRDFLDKLDKNTLSFA